jgi:hypothetical protein
MIYQECSSREKYLSEYPHDKDANNCAFQSIERVGDFPQRILLTAVFVSGRGDYRLYWKKRN